MPRYKRARHKRLLMILVLPTLALGLMSLVSHVAAATTSQSFTDQISTDQQPTDPSYGHFLGQFTSPHDTHLVGYSEGDCRSEGGRFESLDEDEQEPGAERRGFCIFSSEDTVIVSVDDSQLMLLVSTVGGNAHTCDYAGPAWVVGTDTVRSRAPVETYGFDPKTGKELVKQETCQVDVIYKTNDQVSVQTNGKCRSFCGARAGLEVSEAKRK